MTRTQWQLVSEPIEVDTASMSTAGLAAGQPSPPGRFTWRGTVYEVTSVQPGWKKSAAEGGRAGGEKYVRAHYFQVTTRPSAECVLYCLRHPRRKRPSWYLYTIRVDGSQEERASRQEDQP